MAKKPAKKATVTKASEMSCGHGHEGMCFCKGILAILIIVLIWISTATWSKVVITIAAVLILLGSSGCACKKGMKK